MGTHTDARGTLIEVAPQVFVSTTHPGVTRGDHYHYTKKEKFIVVSGDAVIRIRRVDMLTAEEITVSGKNPEVIEIPAMYVHSITNVGSTDMTLVVWASEVFDPAYPDTYQEKV